MALSNDDAAARDLHLTNLSLFTNRTFSSLEAIAQELHILSTVLPSPLAAQDQRENDQRARGLNEQSDYSDRLESPVSSLSGGNSGAILDSKGKLLRPFTLLDKRQRLQQGVFRPDHNLPTMSIDEYLEEEKRRGGIIDGGGPQSQFNEQVDEDDLDKADEETMKARRWDEFTEANPKGSGNRLNLG